MLGRESSGGGETERRMCEREGRIVRKTKTIFSLETNTSEWRVGGTTTTTKLSAYIFRLFIVYGYFAFRTTAS